jgi:hypothetical protein
MITRDDIDSFLDDEGRLEEFYGSPQDAFEDMNDTLIVEDGFADLYGEEQEEFFQFAYTNWMNYVSLTGIEWVEMFQAWRIG